MPGGRVGLYWTESGELCGLRKCSLEKEPLSRVTPIVAVWQTVVLDEVFAGIGLLAGT